MRPDAPIRARGVLDASAGTRAQRRVVRAVYSILSRTLVETEKAIAIREGFEEVDWRKQRLLGGAWALAHRVALVLTDRRLIEIALSFAGRRATGRIREFSWAGAEPPDFDGHFLSFGSEHRWYVRQTFAKTEIAEILKQATGASPLAARRLSSPTEHRRCAKCGAAAPNAGARCTRCGTPRHSTRFASLLAVAFPGAGLAYAQRPGFALLRFLTECCCLAGFAYLMLQAEDLAWTVLLLGAGATALVVIKIESVALTRFFADRAGILGETAVRRWRWLLGIGALLSLAAAVAPVTLAGWASQKIDADLEGSVRYLGWRVGRDRNDFTTDAEDQKKRAEWRHREGWVVSARATPWLELETEAKAQSRLQELLEQHSSTEVSSLHLGSLDVLRAVSSQPVDEGTTERTTVDYYILDSFGRDEHRLSLQVPTTEFVTANARTQQLIRCMYWGPPQPPKKLVPAVPPSE